MNKERLFEIISSPQNLQAESDMPIVKDLIESFPWFPTPYIMLAKMLHDDHSIYFDRNLKLGAAYVGDRELLYNYIKSKKAEKEKVIDLIKEESQVEPIENEPVIEEVQNIENSEPELVLADESQNIEDVAATDVEKEVTGLNVDKEIDEPILESVNEKVEEIFSEKATPEIEALPEAKKIVEPGIFSYAVQDYFGQFYNLDKKNTRIEKEIEAEKENIVDPVLSPHKFSEWFQLLENRPKTKNAEPISENIGPESEQPDIAKDLIDRFIKTEPRIKPQLRKMYNPEDMARQSVQDDMNLATETLANIYRKQGLNKKAIEIFQQLILRFPQKSAYFAEKIREIESEGGNS